MATTRKTVELLMKLKDQLSGPLRNIGDSMKDLGRIAGRFAAAGVAALGAFAVSSVVVASRVEEAISKFGAVFKEEAGRVEDALAEMAETINRSKFDLMEFASTLQDTFVPLGFARDVAADMSIALVALAEDLASFNNIPTAQVVMDLQSALVGNVETLRKYGVALNQETIQAFALTNAIWDGVGAITAQEKAAAILGLTIAGTADAQGDAARTSESFANQMRGLQAEFKDAQVALGEKLIPLILDFTEEQGPAMVDTIHSISDALIAMAPHILAVIGNIATIIKNTAVLAENFGDTSDSLGLMIEGFDQYAFLLANRVAAGQITATDAAEMLTAEIQAQRGESITNMQAWSELGEMLKWYDGVTLQTMADMIDFRGEIEALTTAQLQGLQALLAVKAVFSEEAENRLWEVSDEQQERLGNVVTGIQTIFDIIKEGAAISAETPLVPVTEDVVENVGNAADEMQRLKEEAARLVDKMAELGGAQEERLGNLVTLWSNIIQIADDADERTQQQQEERIARTTEALTGFTEGLAQAALQGEESVKSYFNNMRDEIIKTVVMEGFKQLLQLLLGGGGGKGGGGGLFGLGFLGLQAGGTVPAHRAQAGMIVPGSGFGDQVPMLLEPGEVVLPRGFSREMIQAAMSGGGRSITINDNRRPFISGRNASTEAIAGKLIIEVLEKAGKPL